MIGGAHPCRWTRRLASVAARVVDALVMLATGVFVAVVIAVAIAPAALLAAGVASAARTLQHRLRTQLVTARH